MRLQRSGLCLSYLKSWGGEPNAENISAEKAFLQSIRECRAETVILFEHLKKALASLKEDAEAAGEVYKYEALEMVYVKGMTYEKIVRETGCGKNSPKKWCKAMIPRLAIKLFGVKALDDNTNIAENRYNLNKTE